MKKPSFITFFILLINLINNINCVDIEQEYNYCDGLKVGLQFYKAQRAGVVDLESEFPWQHEMTTKYDTYKNEQMNKFGNGFLSKGYFDAGDYLKITFPLSFSMTTLAWSFLEFHENIEYCRLTDAYLSTLKVGIDWLMAAHPEPNVIYAQCGSEIDHLSWSRADQIYNNSVTGPRNCSLIVDSSNPSSDIAFEMVATMASASMVFEKHNKQYSDACKQHADELWNFAITHPGIQYNAMYPSNVSRDEQIWAAAWMYKLYGPQYTFFLGFFDNGRISHDDLFYSKWSHVYSWNNKMSAACIFIAKHFGIYIDEANELIESWNTNIPRTKDGLFFIDEWGNTRYALSGALLESIWSNKNDRLKTCNTNFAIQQVQIILGNNSNHHSYVSMYGYKNAVQTLNIHHRSSHSPPNGTDLKFDNIKFPLNNKYPVIALLPGPIDLNDTYYEDRTLYNMNEPALDYNSVFVGVFASLINRMKSSKPILSTTIPKVQYDSYDLGDLNSRHIPVYNNQSTTIIDNSSLIETNDDDDEDFKPMAPIFQDSNEEIEEEEEGNNNSTSPDYGGDDEDSSSNSENIQSEGYVTFDYSNSFKLSPITITTIIITIVATAFLI